MMKNKKLLTLIGVGLLVLVLAALPFMTACPKPAPTTPAPTTPSPTTLAPTTPAPEVKKLQIGGLFCLSGWFSPMSTQELNETQIVADMINENGGITIGGQKYEIELVVEDCKSSLDGVTAAADKLVYDDKVQFVVGPAAFFSMAAAPVCDPNEVLHVLGYCTHTPLEIGPQVPYGFLGNGGFEGRLTACLMTFSDLYPNCKKFAVISAAGGSGDEIRTLVPEFLAKFGYSMAGDWIAFPDDATDYSPYITKINSIKDADAIILIHGISTHAGNILKGLRGSGNNKPFGMACVTSSGSIIRAISGVEAADNCWSTSPVEGAPGNPPVLDEVLKRIRVQYGADCPNYFEESAGLYVLAQVIQKAQSLDPTVVKDTWESIDNVDTLFGPGIVCGDQAYGITHHYVSTPMPITMLNKGEVEFYKWFDIGLIP